MPLTPFHLSIAMLGLAFISIFYIPALVISGIIMDIEPLYMLGLSKDGSLHGFAHTYVGATLIALVVAIALIKTRNMVDSTMETLKLGQQKIPEKSIYLSSFIGAYSHILLDSFMHYDMKPFWPFASHNPFLGIVETSRIYEITGLFLVLNIFLYMIRLIKK